MKIIELNHVALHVADVGASAAFYRDGLGLPSLDRPPFRFPGAWFALGSGGQQLHLIGERSDPVHSHNRGNHLALAVESIDAAEERLSKAGIPMFGPKQRPDGVWQIFVRDPDGYYVELCELRG